MSAIVIKTEKVEECEDVKPQINEIVFDIIGGGGGGAGDGATAAASSGVVSNVGPKAIVEKTQAALKVASEAKQLHLRLKVQNPLSQPAPPPPQHRQQTIANKPVVKRPTNNVIKIKTDQLQADYMRTHSPYVGPINRLRVQTPARINKKVNNSSPPPSHIRSQQQHPNPLSPTPIAPSKCGEIFVTNNARKWTFVCTYCQKTTRDIGEFICHIQFKHMLDHYHEDDEGVKEYEREHVTHDEVFTSPQLEEDDEQPFSNHDQEYFDCTNYLDVNVHTESDDMPHSNGGISSKSNVKVSLPSTTTKDNQNRQLANKNKQYVVNLLEYDDDNNPDNGNNSNDIKNDLFDYEMEDEEDGVEIVDDDNDELEMKMNDDDNLLFIRSSSIEEKVELERGGGGGSRSGGKIVNKKYRSHVRGKAYCELCDKTFQYYSLYRNHMIKHSNITPYQCQFCSKAFKSKQAIRYHMNTHTKEVQYTCPLCPTTYGTENQFITHVLIHESDTCFPCMVCAKILASDQEREEHLSTHSEERPFGCSFCNKRFRQKHHLSNHMKLHCHYRCDFCKEEFSSTQTQRRPYACASCEEYPEIRIQVEKQRSKSLTNSEVNPLELTYENLTTEADTTECVDLASEEEDGDESETSTSILKANGGPKRHTCQYCPRSYKQISALNYHIRQKHQEYLRK